MSCRSLLSMLAILTVGLSGAYALDLKDITFNTASAGKVVFSHKTHLKKSAEGSKFTCKSCHTTGKQTTPHYTMAQMEKGESCGKCHNGKTAFPVSKCTACHKVKEITYQVKQTGPVHFSHNKHLETMQCTACHNRLYLAGPNKPVGMAQMKKGKSCGACHDGTKAFSINDCNKCHPTKEIVYQVKETGPTRFSHQSHLKKYSCSACHTKLYSLGKNKRVSMAAMEKGKSCGACHDAKTAFTVKENCETCHGGKK